MFASATRDEPIVDVFTAPERTNGSRGVGETRARRRASAQPRLRAMSATVASSSVTDLALAAKAAARRLAAVPPATKDAALLAIADALEARIPEILEANARDLEAG